MPDVKTRAIQAIDELSRLLTEAGIEHEVVREEHGSAPMTNQIKICKDDFFYSAFCHYGSDGYGYGKIEVSNFFDEPTGFLTPQEAFEILNNWVKHRSEKRMTIEEARNWFIQHHGLEYPDDKTTDYKVHKLALDALEKQIPKKPEFWHNQPCPPEWADDDWGYRCPACGNEEIDYPEHHCVCGQAIDWSEENG